jgi:hypothetical protein
MERKIRVKETARARMTRGLPRGTFVHQPFHQGADGDSKRPGRKVFEGNTLHQQST